MKLPDTKLNTFARIRELSPPKDMIFACALMQRMLPNYQLFSVSQEFGDKDTAESILNLVWDWCITPKSKFNAAAQLEKLEEIIPDVDKHEVFAVYPALDYCMALSVALQNFLKEHDFPAVTIAKLSQGSVEAYILASSEQSLSNQELKQNELMNYEIETQNSLLSYIAENKLSKDDIKLLRDDLKADCISNLGIEKKGSE